MIVYRSMAGITGERKFCFCPMMTFMQAVADCVCAGLVKTFTYVTHCMFVSIAGCLFLVGLNTKIQMLAARNYSDQ